MLSISVNKLSNLQFIIINLLTVCISCNNVKFAQPQIVDSVGNHQNGVQEGFWKYRSASGQVVKSGSFIHGHKNGLWTIFDAQGNPEVRQDYKNDLLHGPSTSYSEGKLYTETNYDNGCLSGLSKTYHSNGKLNFSTTYRGCKENGLFSLYDTSGQLVQQGYMVNSLMKGKWLEWNKKTQKMDTVYYK